MVNEIYRLTSGLPQSENFGLISQMRRSAVSIPSNIAEGYKRRSSGQYLQFLSIADGSSAELETQLVICKANFLNLNYRASENLLNEVQKMLFVMIQRTPSK